MKKTVLMLLIVALSATLLIISCTDDGGTVVVGDIPSDYIIRWHLDGNGDDEGGVHNLSFSGNYDYSSTDQKEGSHCLLLDGLAASIHYGDHSLANDAVTILMWLYVDESATGEPNALTYVDNGIKYDTATNLFQGYIGADNIAASSMSCSRDQWHHVVLTFDGSLDTLNLYVDNRGPYAASSTDSIDNLGNEWWLGSKWSLPEYWVGMIDDVVIYERALSDAEVRALYN